MVACVASDGVRVFDAATARLLRTERDRLLFESWQEEDAGFLQPEDEPACITGFWQNSLQEFRPTCCSDQGMDMQRIAFSPDGRIAAIVHGRVTLVDTDSHKVRCVLECALGRIGVRTVAFSPDGALLAAAGDSQVIHLWHVESGKEVAGIGTPPAALWSVAVSPMGQHVIAGARNGRVSLYHRQQDSISQLCDARGDAAVHVEFSPTSEAMVVGFRGGRIQVFGSSDFQQRFDVQAHEARLLEGSFSADGARFISVGYSGYSEPPDDTELRAEVSIWSTRDWNRLESRPLPGGFRVRCVSASEDRQRLAISSWKQIILADVSTSIQLHVLLKTKRVGINRIEFVPGDRELLIANEGYGMRIVDLASKAQARSFVATRDGPTSLAFTAAGRMLARATAYFNEIELFDVQSGKLKKYFIGHQNAVAALAFTPDTRWLVSAGFDGTLKLWDAESGSLDTSVLPGPDVCHSWRAK